MGRRRKKYDYRDETPYERYIREHKEPNIPGLEILSFIGGFGRGILSGLVTCFWLFILWILFGIILWIFD